MNAAIPAIKIADYTHALGMRCPDREVNAGILADFTDVRAELVVKSPVLSFVEQMHVDFTHDYAIRIGIARDLFAPVPAFNLQGVWDITRAFLQCGLEKTLALNFFFPDNRDIVVEPCCTLA